MAAASPLQELQENATCSLCLSFFVDPMMIVQCGHNFCKACINVHWDGSHRNVSCPQCGVDFLRVKLKPNKQLKNVVEAAQKLLSQDVSSLENLCSFHEKPMEHFCQDDDTILCETCVGGEEHEGHAIMPVGEAVKEQKSRIQDCLKGLKEEKGATIHCLHDTQQKIHSLLNRIRHNREIFTAEIKKFYQSVKDQEHFLFFYLDEIETIIKKKDSKSKAIRDITELSGLILTAEKLCNLSGTEFLKKITKLNGLISDIQTTSSRIRTQYEQECANCFSLNEWCYNEDVPCEEHFVENSLCDLEKRRRKIAKLIFKAQMPLKECRDKVITEMWQARKEVLKPYLAENVVLDCDTTHKLLTVSEDQKSVWFARGEGEEDPYWPRRPIEKCYLLGTRGYNSGRFFWKVDVEEGKEWNIGVAKESIKSKTCLSLDPVEDVWVIGVNQGCYLYFSSSFRSINLSEPLRTIEVYLDYEAGELSFFDVDSKSIIFTFPPVNFGGEKIYPFFCIRDGRIKIYEVEN